MTQDKPNDELRTPEQLLYRLHGYDKGEVPLLDVQITEALAALDRYYKAQEERSVLEAVGYIQNIIDSHRELNDDSEVISLVEASVSVIKEKGIEVIR